MAKFLLVVLLVVVLVTISQGMPTSPPSSNGCLDTCVDRCTCDCFPCDYYGLYPPGRQGTNNATKIIALRVNHR
ncbi:hypothetical protein CASFOL_008559 [Castilleja foliolosa]|uniref:Uncharacterized protein n=1 Tax=Castilleja foliolosa TaxID=1961234 RepID=A0ABD3E3D2_9LAMI